MEKQPIFQPPDRQLTYPSKHGRGKLSHLARRRARGSGGKAMAAARQAKSLNKMMCSAYEDLEP